MISPFSFAKYTLRESSSNPVSVYACVTPRVPGLVTQTASLLNTGGNFDSSTWCVWSDLLRRVLQEVSQNWHEVWWWYLEKAATRQVPLMPSTLELTMSGPGCLFILINLRYHKSYYHSHDKLIILEDTDGIGIKGNRPVCLCVFGGWD